MPVNLWKGIWTVLNTEIQIPWSSAVSKGAEAGKTALEMAKALKENRQAQDLAPLIGRIDPLLGVLNSPLAQVAGAGLPFVSLGVGLLKFIVEQTRQEPSIEICVALVGQIAYLESFQQFLNEFSYLYPNLDMSSDASERIAEQLEELGELELCEREAQATLVCFHTSKLANKFNPILVARLKEAGLEENLAKRLTERVSRNTHRYMKKVLFEAKKSESQLASVYESSWEQDLQDQISVDSYLQDQISSNTRNPEHQTRWKVFDESFTIKDIYVPLKAQPLDRTGRPLEVKLDSLPILEEWAEQFLDDSNPIRHKQVMFIQAAPGRGKTVFCRVFADWVREHLNPIWTPILIRLRDIGTLETNFEMTLQAAVNAGFAKDDKWLYNPNVRFLFLLDGFDELLMEGRTTGGLKKFLEQVGHFQLTCQASPDMQHRILITGRTLALQEIERNLPLNLERVKILPMSKDLQEEWLARWGRQIGLEKANAFQTFLESPNIPEPVIGKDEKIGLAQEPLLLYLLAAMHRDQELTATMFEGIEIDQAKILIYERSLEWALNRKRNPSDDADDLNRKFIMLKPDDLRRILQEAGLCVIQSGGEWASMNMIGDRLKDEDARQFLEEAQREIGESPLRNALVSFYLQPASNRREGGVEFVHKSFGEFLCAERIKESLDLWAELSKHRNRKYYIDTPKMCEEIYDLFGFGYLSSEVVDFLMELIRSETRKSSAQGRKEHEENKIRILFRRLEEFFESWCKGKFIDDCTEKIPMRTAQRLKPFLANPLGQRQVDIYTGLNVFIILMNFHQMNIPELNFDLCKNSDGSNTWLRLSSVISYCSVLDPSAFVDVASKFLSGAQLQCAHLRRVDLKGANFAEANLSDADLCRADLTNANLKGAIMHNAYLRGADLKDVQLNEAELINADLCRAYLYNANLSQANLSNASLKGANLEIANLEGAILRDIVWDATTQWFCCEGLHKALEIPQNLESYEDFHDARDLSKCLESWLNPQNKKSRDEKLSQEWLTIASRIKNRRGNSVYAHILNKFAWLSCLQGYGGEDIVNISREAVANSPNSGNYMDTFAVALVMHYDTTGLALDLDNLDTNDTIYRNSIHFFRKALESDDFKKLALPNAYKMRKRRDDWIEELKQDRNPFNPEVLAVLRREER